MPQVNAFFRLSQISQLSQLFPTVAREWVLITYDWIINFAPFPGGLGRFWEFINKAAICRINKFSMPLKVSGQVNFRFRYRELNFILSGEFVHLQIAIQRKPPEARKVCKQNRNKI